MKWSHHTIKSTSIIYIPPIKKLEVKKLENSTTYTNTTIQQETWYY